MSKTARVKDICTTIVTLAVEMLILFTPKEGSNTVKGSAPLATPNRAVPGLIIAVCMIKPMLLLLSLIEATTLTAGDVWAVAVLVRSNFTTQEVPAMLPVDVAVKTSIPVCIHAPEVPKTPDDDTVKFDASNVCEPVSPKIVTIEAALRL